MKKFIALIAALVLCLSLGAANADELSDAKSYLYYMYRNQVASTPVDYEVVGGVKIGNTVYEIEWSADSDTIQFIRQENGMVLVDVDDKNPEEVIYKLTATFKGEGDRVETVTFERKVPAALVLEGMTYAEIVDYAYTLEDQQASTETFRLYGTVTKIDSAWSEQYGNITVTIAVAGKEDMPIQCYRLKGEGAQNLQVGDAITVEGILKNYKGTYEFDSGCVLVGYGEYASQQAILDAAYKLEAGAAMPNMTALEGEVVSIDTAWSEQYGNITVTIVCDGKTEQPIMCYRLKGEGAATLAVGDKIGVYGTIKNYKGTIEFDSGCTLIPYGGAANARTVLNAYTLEDGMAMTTTSTLTGVIHKIPTIWSDEYQNITVDMTVSGMTDYPIECYRLSGEGAKDLAIGDTITVTGTIKNYKGLIEFDKGCQLVSVVKGEVAEDVVPPTTLIPETAEETAAILDAAYALEEGAYMYDKAQLTGVITEITTAYSEQYGNITVMIVCADKTEQPLMCFRLKGEGAAELAVGDTITVEGAIKNYSGTIEFDAGCTLISVVKTN